MTILCMTARCSRTWMAGALFGLLLAVEQMHRPLLPVVHADRIAYADLHGVDGPLDLVGNGLARNR